MAAVVASAVVAVPAVAADIVAAATAIKTDVVLAQEATAYTSHDKVIRPRFAREIDNCETRSIP